jgi:hypothetical protein
MLDKLEGRDNSSTVAQTEKETDAIEEKVEELKEEYEVKKSLAQINAQLGKGNLSDATRNKWENIAKFNGYNIDSKTGLAAYKSQINPKAENLPNTSSFVQDKEKEYQGIPSAHYTFCR